MSWLQKKRKKWHEGGAHKFGENLSPVAKLHESMKKQRDVATGKEAGKDAAYEQKKQGEVIAKQQQVEQLRLAESQSDIKKRQLLSRSGGNQSLMRTLG